jgi:hypothetical protein
MKKLLDNLNRPISASAVREALGHLLFGFLLPYSAFRRSLTVDYKPGRRPASDVHFRIRTRVFDSATGQPIPDAVLMIGSTGMSGDGTVAVGYSVADGLAHVQFSAVKRRQPAGAFTIQSMYLRVLENGYQPILMNLAEVQNRMDGIAMRKMVPIGKNITAAA